MNLVSRALFLGALLGATCSASAQVPAENPEAPSLDPAAQKAMEIARLDHGPDLESLSQIIRTLQTDPALSPDFKSAIDSLIKQAEELEASGRGAEARRALFHASYLALGRPWDSETEFAASLAVRLDRPISDTAEPLLVQLSQSFPAQYKPQSDKLQMKLTLIDQVPASVKVIKELGSDDVPVRDLNENPFRAAVDLRDAPDGDHMLIAQVLDGAKVLGSAETNVTVLHNLAARRSDIERRLANIKGHDDTKASILYPFDHIRSVNAGTGESLNYDYVEALKRSDDLLAALETGKDPLYQAVGDQRRAYYFTDADEIMPYRLYVPTTWRPGKKLSLILALHGGGLDENDMLMRGGKAMEKLAETYSYIVVGPLGYRLTGGFGEFPPPPEGSQPDFGLEPIVKRDPQQLQLSEKDTLNVLDRVSAEYDIDQSRIYIMGNSTGAGGTWLIASQYPQRFAAAAPCASSADIRGLNFESFKTVPVMACVGSLDSEARKQVAQYGVEQVTKAGGEASYVEILGGTHGTAVDTFLPQMFAFFSAHQKST